MSRPPPSTASGTATHLVDEGKTLQQIAGDLDDSSTLDYTNCVNTRY